MGNIVVVARRLLLLLVLLVAVAVLSAGCGRRDEPAPSTTAERVGTRLDALPRYPRSQMAGEETTTGDHSTQSYSATGTTPEEILRWYVDRLDGWVSVSAPHEVRDDWIGTWRRSGRILRITAAPAPTLRPGSDSVVQYSLELRPSGS